MGDDLHWPGGCGVNVIPFPAKRKPPMDCAEKLARLAILCWAPVILPLAMMAEMKGKNDE